jgi:hypothetical protein
MKKKKEKREKREKRKNKLEILQHTTTLTKTFDFLCCCTVLYF